MFIATSTTGAPLVSSLSQLSRPFAAAATRPAGMHAEAGIVVGKRTANGQPIDYGGAGAQ